MRSKDVLSAYVRSLLQAEWASGKSDAAIALEVGVSGPAINQIRNGKRGIGNPESFVARFGGGSTDELWRLADEWWKTQPHPKGEPAVVKDDRYPNRGKAITAARALGLDEPAIEQVAGYMLESHRDPEPLWWLDQIRAKQGELRYAAKGPVSPPVPVAADASAAPKNAWRRRRR